MKVNKHETEDELWKYNLIDCVRTRECGEVELENIESMGLRDVEVFQQELFWPVLQAMQRGVRIDLSARKQLSEELKVEMQKRELYFKDVLGHDLNPRSPLQMCSLFYDDMKNQPIMTKTKKGVPGHVTCDDAALTIIARREPLMHQLIATIREYRTLGVLKSTFVEMELDVDNRMRTSYNICGTETFRLSSSKNAFGTGGNLQTIPGGTDT